MQGHFGGDPFQRLRLEVGITHPVFDGVERMLNRFTTLAHPLRMFVEPLLNLIKNMFVLPGQSTGGQASDDTEIDNVIFLKTDRIFS